MLWCRGVLMFWCTDALVVWCWIPSALVLWCRWSRWPGCCCWLSPGALFFGLLLLYFAVLACARNSRPWHLTGALMLWYSDALVYWCSDALVHWCAGALKPGGQWQIGKEPNGLPAAWAACCLLVMYFFWPTFAVLLSSSMGYDLLIPWCQCPTWLILALIILCLKDFRHSTLVN